MKRNNPERRKTQRLNTKFVLDFSDGLKFFQGYLLDIGPGGVQIESPEPCPKDANLTISMPFEPPLKLNGIVRWSQRSGLNYRIGLEFTGLSDEQQVRMRQIIQAFFWETYKR